MAKNTVDYESFKYYQLCFNSSVAQQLIVTFIWQSYRGCKVIVNCFPDGDVYTRQVRKISPAFLRLRVDWPNIVPYMEIHSANFPGLSGI